MALRFRRRRNGPDHLRERLAADAAVVQSVLDEASEPGRGDEPALEDAVERLFEREPTADIATLRDRASDGAAFFADEIKPNWDGASEYERATKVAAFMRLANVLGLEDAAGVGPVVRTKVLVLAWAHDRAHGGDLLREVAARPQRFGSIELSAPA